MPGRIFSKQFAHERGLKALSPKEYAERQTKQFVRMRRLEVSERPSNSANLDETIRMYA